MIILLIEFPVAVPLVSFRNTVYDKILSRRWQRNFDKMRPLSSPCLSVPSHEIIREFMNLYFSGLFDISISNWNMSTGKCRNTSCGFVFLSVCNESRTTKRIKNISNEIYTRKVKHTICYVEYIFHLKSYGFRDDKSEVTRLNCK
jgi:hypothetical protein